MHRNPLVLASGKALPFFLLKAHAIIDHHSHQVKTFISSPNIISLKGTVLVLMISHHMTLYDSGVDKLYS